MCVRVGRGDYLHLNLSIIMPSSSLASLKNKGGGGGDLEASKYCVPRLPTPIKLHFTAVTRWVE